MARMVHHCSVHARLAKAWTCRSVLSCAKTVTFAHQPAELKQPLRQTFRTRRRCIQHTKLHASSSATTVETTDSSGSSGTGPPQPSPSTSQSSNTSSSESDHILRPFHVVLLFILFCAGILIATLVVCLTSHEIGLRWALYKVLQRVVNSIAFRQLLAIMMAMGFVRYGLEPVARVLRRITSRGKELIAWENSNEHNMLQQVYHPMEWLLLTAAFCTAAENLFPSLIMIPKEIMRRMSRVMLSLTFVVAFSRIVWNIKTKVLSDTKSQLEKLGDTTGVRRVEGLDKLITVGTIFISSVLGLQAVGLDINSVLTISGFGGLALGLAGREILENMFNGLLIVSSRAFEVGEEIIFHPGGQEICGIVMEIGWYRTLIKSFEREVFVIPNSVFSRTVVRNVTRKGKEWRVFENIGLQVEDIDKAGSVVADMRKVIRQDPRVIHKLHRRIFLDKITREEITIYMSFYIEAANRDAFMAVKQDLLLAFNDIVKRNGAQLARNYLRVRMDPLPGPPEPSEAIIDTQAYARSSTATIDMDGAAPAMRSYDGGNTVSSVDVGVWRSNTPAGTATATTTTTTTEQVMTVASHVAAGSPMMVSMDTQPLSATVVVNNTGGGGSSSPQPGSTQVTRTVV